MRGIFKPTVNLSDIKSRELSCLVRQQMDVNFMQNRAFFLSDLKTLDGDQLWYYQHFLGAS